VGFAQVSLLDFALGDRAGTYLLSFCLLVTALVIISAIVDIPVRALDDAGYVRRTFAPRLLPPALLRVSSAITLVLAFAGAAVQAYLASAPFEIQGNALALWVLTNVAFFSAVALWGLTSPLTRHWGLSLGAFGLGVAGLFLMLAAVLQLPFTTTGVLLSTSARMAFGGIAGGILVAVGICLSAVVALVAHIGNAAFILAAEHRRHENSPISDWSASRRSHFRRFRTRSVVPAASEDPSD
jgi:hypothetical protein